MIRWRHQLLSRDCLNMFIFPIILLVTLLSNPTQAHVPSYRIIRQIGKGTFSTVHLGERCHPNDQCDLVAIKIIPHRPSPASHEEVEILQSVDYPNIVDYIDHFTAGLGQTLYIVTELVDGCHLSSYLRKFPHQLVALLKSLIETLAYLHVRRITHGDLQSSNIMVTKDGILKVIDFGCGSILNYEEEKRFRDRVAHDLMDLGVLFDEFEPIMLDGIFLPNVIKAYKHLKRYLISNYRMLSAHDILHHPLFLL